MTLIKRLKIMIGCSVLMLTASASPSLRTCPTSIAIALMERSLLMTIMAMVGMMIVIMVVVMVMVMHHLNLQLKSCTVVGKFAKSLFIL